MKVALGVGLLALGVIFSPSIILGEIEKKPAWLGSVGVNHSLGGNYWGIWGGHCPPDKPGILFQIQWQRHPSDWDIYDFTRHKAENIMEDRFDGESEASWSLSCGPTVKSSDSGFVFVAAEIEFVSRYRKYYDKYEIFGTHGHYLIKDGSAQRLGVNLGVVQMFQKCSFQLSWSSVLGRVMIGVGLTA